MCSRNKKLLKVEVGFVDLEVNCFLEQTLWRLHFVLQIYFCSSGPFKEDDGKFLLGMTTFDL